MNWIKIEDREPQEGQKVLVYGRLYCEYEDTEDNYSIQYVIYTGKVSNLVNEGHNMQLSCDITHWQEVNNEIPTN